MTPRHDGGVKMLNGSVRHTAAPKSNKTGNVHINVPLRRVRVTILTCKSSKYHLFWVRVYSHSYAARKAHAPCRIAVCGLFGYPYFPALSHKLKKIITEHKMCVLIFPTTISETFAILRINPYIITKVIHFYVQYCLCLSDFSTTWMFSTDLGKNLQISYLMSIRQVGAELFQVNRTTDGHRQTWRQQSLFAILRMRLKTRCLRSLQSATIVTDNPLPWKRDS